MKDLLTVKQLAALLNVSLEEIQTWQASGAGPKYCELMPGVIRYRPEHVDAWLKSKCSSLDATTSVSQERLTQLKLTYGSAPFTHASVSKRLAISLAQSKRIVNSLLLSGSIRKLDKKAGKAFMFEFTD